MSSTRIWSPYQKAIFQNLSKGEGHLIIEALAGSGKTTSLINGFKFIPKNKKILALAFNTDNAKDLKNKAPSYVDCFTFHSHSFHAIKQKFPNIIIDKYKCQNIIQELIPGVEYDLQNSLYETIDKCKARLEDTPNQILNIIDQYNIDLCNIEEEKFIQHVVKIMSASKKDTSCVDFMDMCWFSFVFNLNLGNYQYVAVDEFQDCSKVQHFIAQKSCNPNGGRRIYAGDSLQCVDENTLVKTKLSIKKIKNIKINDMIASYENGEVKYKKILRKEKSNWKFGVKITTKSGKSLTMSPNHRIWAEQQEVNGKFLVYLMYRHDLGFRIGKTNKWKAKSNPFGARALHEQADKLWIIDVVNSNEEAILTEECYSLKYGIPTSVFNAAERYINQDRIDAIFKIFGQNGLKLLEDKNYHFDYPHWIGRSMSASNRSRLVVRISSHSKSNKKKYSNELKIRSLPGRTGINFELSDNVLIEKLKSAGVSGKMYKRRSSDLEHFSIRKLFKKYTDAIKYANFLSETVGEAYITENLSFGKEDDLRLITASALFVGMKIISNQNDIISKDEILSIEKVNGSFYDIEVEDSANFFGNDILSHNCIYEWRSADLTPINELKKLSTTKVLTLPISYRCPKKVIELVKNWATDITCPDDAIEGEVNNISTNEMFKKATGGCFILSRYNAPLVPIAFEFIRQGKKANIRGRDIGKNLSMILKKSKKKRIDAFLTWLESYKKKELELLLKKKIKPDNLIDRCDCLVFLASEVKTVQELSNKIDKLFSDAEEKDTILLSSIHRAKGKEANDVFVLKWTLRGDLENAQFIEKPNEEYNLIYVGFSRAISRLFLVNQI